MTSLEALQTPEQDSGWIEHEGIKRPVPAHEWVVGRFRSGNCTLPTTADMLDWSHLGARSDIVAYKLHKPSPSSQGEEQ